MSTTSPDIQRPAHDVINRITTTEEIDDETRKGVAGNLNAIGERVTPKDLNPNDESPLQTLTRKLDEAGYAAGSTLDETLSGKGSYPDVRTTPGKRLGRWVLDRARRLIHKKAA